LGERESYIRKEMREKARYPGRKEKERLVGQQI
jgi:hypothetical protein